MKKSLWKKLPCSEGLATLLVHKGVAASIGEWRETLFQMPVRLYTSDQELHSGYVQSNRCAALFIMLWHYDCQCAELKKVSSHEINSHRINFPWGQLPQNRLNAIFNIQIYQNTELIWWITHDKVNGRSAIICLFYTGFAGTEKRIMTARTQIEKVADAKQ